LTFRAIEKCEIGFGNSACPLGVYIAVHDRDRRLGKDALGRDDNFEPVRAKLPEDKERFAFPGDQHVALAPQSEGRGRAAGTGIENRDVAVDDAHEFPDPGLVAPKLVLGVAPGCEVIPARSA